MTYEQLSIEGVWLLTPRVFGDERGYFMETFKADEFCRNIGDVTFIQDNESQSSHGVVRGLHYQAGDRAQAKLVRVTEGRILDVIVDLRKKSPTFGQHLAIELSDVNKHQMFIPRGFAHGFAVLSDTARFQYKVDNVYDPSAERTLLFNDADLGIVWPVDNRLMTVSQKDLNGVRFNDLADLF